MALLASCTMPCARAARPLLDPRHPRRADEAGADRARRMSASRSSTMRSSCTAIPTLVPAGRLVAGRRAASRPLLRYTGYVDEGATPVADRMRADGHCRLRRIERRVPAALPRRPRGGSRFAGAALAHSGRARRVGRRTSRRFGSAAPPHVTVERARPISGAARAGGSSRSARPATTRPWIFCAAACGRFWCRSRRATRPSSACGPNGCGRGSRRSVPEAELDRRSPRRGGRDDARIAPAAGRASVALDGASEASRIVEELRVPRARASRPNVGLVAPGRALGRARDRGRELASGGATTTRSAAYAGLDRLLGLADRIDAAIALAAIPARASLAAGAPARGDHALRPGPWLRPRQPCPAGREEGRVRTASRMSAVMEGEAREALQIARASLRRQSSCRSSCRPGTGSRRHCVPALPRLGYVGLSTFRDRPAADRRPGPAGQHPCGSDRLARHAQPASIPPDRAPRPAPSSGARPAQADPDEPIGFLTHHLVHDEAIWAFCEDSARPSAQKRLHFCASSEVIL